MAPGESKKRSRDHQTHGAKRKSHGQSPRKPQAAVIAPASASSSSGSQALSANSLARLNLINQHERSRAARDDVQIPKTRKKRHRELPDERFVVEKRKAHKRKKRRVVSGAMMEEGNGPELRGIRGGDRYDEKHGYEDNGGGRKKKLCEFN